MADVFEIARERSARRAVEIAEVDDFIRMARSWWETVESTQRKSTTLQALPQ